MRPSNWPDCSESTNEKQHTASRGAAQYPHSSISITEATVRVRMCVCCVAQARTEAGQLLRSTHLLFPRARAHLVSTQVRNPGAGDARDGVTRALVSSVLPHTRAT